MQLTAEQRHLSAQRAAYARWARVADRRAENAPLQRGQMAWYERQVDPHGVLDATVRAAMARSAQKAHMADLALKSSLARSKPQAPALKAVCSWCHPKTAGKTCRVCERHARTLDAMVAEVRARHAGEKALLKRAARLALAA